jgi:asparagine synthase (glutamine-hydrolysing)
MCGIAGIFKSDQESCVSRDDLASMTEIIKHRGPDDSGILLLDNVGLGHRRLSIIDLSGGHQPMSDHFNDTHIVFNGEIYNYRELREELIKAGCNIRSNSDTEIILHAYSVYGELCVEKFNGMFSFAIWDRRKRILFLARDRLGKKPLYYYQDDAQFVFASEIKAITVLNSVKKSLNLQAIDKYFSYFYIPEPDTIFNSIQCVPPAHTVRIENGKVSFAKYWNPLIRENRWKGEDEWSEEINELLVDSVRLRMISDVPIGVFLSGGIDSSSITGLMAGLSSQKIRTFSIRGGAEEFDETPFARAVVDKYQTDHIEMDIIPERIEDLLPSLVKFFGQPFADSSMIPTYQVSKLARMHVKVALSGEGGDELFAGYDWHRKFLVIARATSLSPNWFRKHILENFLPAYNEPVVTNSLISRILNRASLATQLSLKSSAECYQAFFTSFDTVFKSKVYDESFRSKLTSFTHLQTNEVASVFENTHGSLLSRALQTDQTFYLPSDLLQKVDRMSMANSLEVRSPFLDYRLVELAANIPDQFKIRGDISKYILKYSMRNVLPDIVLNRKTKRGFSIPVSKWFRGNLFDFASTVLLESRSNLMDIFSKPGLRMILAEHRSGRMDYGPQIWALVVYALWAESSGL